MILFLYIIVAFVLAMVTAVILNLLGRMKRFGKLELMKDIRNESRNVTGMILSLVWLFWPVVLLFLAIVVPFALAAWLLGIASGGGKKGVE